MGRRVMIGIFAAMALVAISWTDAAAVCLQYRTIGGSSVCCRWSTKGVQVDIDFNQACGTSGGNCSASAEAKTNDSIAFCRLIASPNTIRRTTCTQTLFYSGNSDECVPKHDPQDVDPDFPGQPGHQQHGCVANVVLQTPDCSACCNTSTETCEDVTPVEMQTSITTFVNFGYDYDGNGGGGSSGPGCSSTSLSSACTWEETCSINPRKIVFIDPDFPPDPTLSREYQCNLEQICNGTSCGGD